MRPFKLKEFIPLDNDNIEETLKAGKAVSVKCTFNAEIDQESPTRHEQWNRQIVINENETLVAALTNFHQTPENQNWTFTVTPLSYYRRFR